MRSSSSESHAGCGSGDPRGCLLASAFADSALLPPKLAKEIKDTRRAS